MSKVGKSGTLSKSLQPVPVAPSKPATKASTSKALATTSATGKKINVKAASKGGSPLKKSAKADNTAPTAAKELKTSAPEAAPEEAQHISAADLALKNGNVLLRYNHYKEEFVIVDGRLTSSEIDERFCLSFAFPKCRLHMTDVEGSASANVDEDEGGFANMQTGKTYWVLVEEDAEEAKLSEERNRAYVERKAKQRDEPVCQSEKRGVALLTEELKKLSAEELREAGPRYKELLAARDLEDCLFS